ncbi:hypothetical protein QJS04_geneDACA020906 [Acorus gramineus]|uniref:Glyoxal oxidase N-terminal domain-containing protein n=1 Tax=Acorus gramineus TaxID=55184 RepID=A0AAV9B3D3_ACOGR|nr:hypothetical protein QJS04_geneDACA020906 [Acorus gramineus]
MHMQLFYNNKVLVFNCTSFGPSFLPLPSTLCSSSSNCTTHSLLLDPTIFYLSPQHLLSNTFCSSASPLPDSTLLQSGGFSSGNRVLRPCPPPPPPSTTG